MQTMTEREQRLSKVAAFNDERTIERRVQLLIDKGDYQAAKTLLLSVSFQKVHRLLPVPICGTTMQEATAQLSFNT
jgi:hypothetical protein